MTIEISKKKQKKTTRIKSLHNSAIMHTSVKCIILCMSLCLSQAGGPAFLCDILRFMRVCSCVCFLCVWSVVLSLWRSQCQCCSHSGYRHPVAAVDLLATYPPPSPASSLITLAYWSSQGHGTLELKLGLHQLMTDYSPVGPWEQAGGVRTEGAWEHWACSALHLHFSPAHLIAELAQNSILYFLLRQLQDLSQNGR